MAFPEVGDTIDIFVLRSQLHKGAMSTLFLAEDLLSRKNVVLKIPFEDILNNPILLYHYQNEDRISRRMDHPGIIRFVHRQRSRQYIIMEHVVGKDLRSRFGQGRPIELSSALTLMDQLCGVVDYLHENAIVHLDLKPENIICLENGTIKLVDFGLASCGFLPDFLAVDFKNPQGTPWYIAPEQLLGERSDPRCDIYSMGMLLYEMVTGQLPWPRSGKVSIARRRLRHDPVPPRYYHSAIPPQIQAIILRAIARHAKDRYPCVKELQHDLNCWQKLPITPAGRKTKKVPFWQYLFSGKPIKPVRRQKQFSFSEKKPQIICSLVDSPGNQMLLAEVKKQVFFRSGEVTLVHVIEEESDSPLRRYGIAVEGERLMGKIEEAVQVLRRFGIEPGIRLIRGNVVDVLTNLCKELAAELMILGFSGKKKGVLQQLIKNSPCPTWVAGKEPYSPAEQLAGLSPEQLAAEQVLDLDIFLVDLWYEHLHYHTTFIYQRLLYPEQLVDLNEQHCKFGRFLASFETNAGWKKILSDLVPIHRQFHEVAKQMTQLEYQNHSGLQHLYARKSLPLSLRLKNELEKVSRCLRQHLDMPPPILPFLADTACPFKVPDTPRYGPLLRLFNIDQDLNTLIQREQKTLLPLENRGKP